MSSAPLSVVCPQCGSRSYHPQDIEHQFCGRCRVFWGEPPLEPYEIDEWLARLGPTDQERITLLKDLLRNANQDSMSETDRRICREALTKLQDKRLARAPVVATPSGPVLRAKDLTKVPTRGKMRVNANRERPVNPAASAGRDEAKRVDSTTGHSLVTEATAGSPVAPGEETQVTKESIA